MLNRDVNEYEIHYIDNLRFFLNSTTLIIIRKDNNLRF